MNSLRCFCVPYIQSKRIQCFSNSGVLGAVYFNSSEIQGTLSLISPAGSEASGPQLLPVRALNEVFIGESLSSRYLDDCDWECRIQRFSTSFDSFIQF